jgi:hypothetical protein
MPRSLARGDYSLVAVVESASSQDSWYRNMADRATHAISCDCASWCNSGVDRGCKHTDFTSALCASAHGQAPTVDTLNVARVRSHPLITATQQQWDGLSGQWSLEMGRGEIAGAGYLVTLLRLETGNGDIVTGVVAFCDRHHPTLATMTPAVVGWAGYAIASECARRSGSSASVGQPPEHYRFRPSSRASAARGRAGVPPARAGQSRVYLRDILRVTDLRDGMTPDQRGENTLRIFFGQDYAVLERQHFLDLSSRFFPGTVYRLRRDPAKRTEHRVRVFEDGRYVRDLCIIRGMTCPESDWYLSVYLRLATDERGLLAMLSKGNIWEPYSDDHTRETLPAVWQPAPQFGVSA